MPEKKKQNELSEQELSEVSGGKISVVTPEVRIELENQVTNQTVNPTITPKNGQNVK